MSPWLERLKGWARAIRRDVAALYLARHDPLVPWYAKALAIGVVAYAVSPIDLIPDFIPVLGYADDLVILPLGILLVVKMIPPEVMAAHRAKADELIERPGGRAAAAVIIAVWLALAVALWRLAWGGIDRPD